MTAAIGALPVATATVTLAAAFGNSPLPYAAALPPGCHAALRLRAAAAVGQVAERMRQAQIAGPVRVMRQVHRTHTVTGAVNKPPVPHRLAAVGALVAGFPCGERLALAALVRRAVAALRGGAAVAATCGHGSDVPAPQLVHGGFAELDG